MTLEEAKQAVRYKGTSYGEVFPQLKVRDAIVFKRWYLDTHKVPNLVAREASKPQLSGRVCHCGGQLVRTGSCETCQSCGYNEGCG